MRLTQHDNPPNGGDDTGLRRADRRDLDHTDGAGKRRDDGEPVEANNEGRQSRHHLPTDWRRTRTLLARRGM